MSGRLSFPPLYIDSRPVQPSQLLTPLLPEEELIPQTRQKWLVDANEIVPDSQKACIDCNNRMLDGLRIEAAFLRTFTESSHEIQSQLNQTIADYDAFRESFPIREVKQVRVQDTSLADKFREAKKSFSVYHMPSPAPPKKGENPLRSYYREQDQKQTVDALKGLHVGSTVIQLAGATVVAGAKAACSITPETKEACKTTLNFAKETGKAILTATGTKEIVKKGLDYLKSCDGSSLVPGFVDLGFPENQAKQLASQSAEDVKVATTFFVASAALKLGAEVLRKVAQLRRPPHSFATDTNNTVYKVYFTHPHLSGPSFNLPARVSTSFSARSVTVRLPPTQLRLPAPSSAAAGYSLQVSTSAVTFPKVTFAAASSAPSSSAAGGLIELGKASNVDKTLHDIYSAIEPSSSHQSLDHSLYHSRKEVVRALPTLSFVEKAHLTMLRHQLSHHTPHANRALTLKEFKSLTTAVRAALGLDILRSFGLRHLSLPEEKALGVSNVSTKRPTAFILRDQYAKTLLEWLEEFGSVLNLLSPEERSAVMKSLYPAALYAGRIEAELQTKSSRFPLLSRSYSEPANQQSILFPHHAVEEAREILSQIAEKYGIQYTENLGPLIENFRKNPGGVSAGLGPVRASHLSFNPQAPLPLGIFDTQFVPTTVDSLWQPMKLISEGYWDFPTMFLIEGHLAGLNLKEIKNLLQTYDNGYFPEYAGPLHSDPADRFFHLYSCLRAVKVVSQQGAEGSCPHQANDLLNHLTHEINTILGSQPKTPPPVARPTQRQMFATATRSPDRPVHLFRTSGPYNPSTAVRVNQAADRYLYFPNKVELAQSTLSDIHDIWGRNLTTLIGIFSEESVSPFALYGTDQAGIKAITSIRHFRPNGDRHISKHIRAPGYYHPVNPIEQVADVSNMAHKAASHVPGQGGGIFVLDTKAALPCGKSFVTEVPKLPLDTPLHERLLNLMKRKGDGPLITRMENGGTGIEEGALLNVDEFHLRFSPFTYSKVVQGLIQAEDTFYLGKSSPGHIPGHTPGRSPGRSPESLLEKRLQLQEIVIGALDRLNALGDFSRVPWKVYHEAGKDLTALPKGSIAVPFSEAIHVERHFAKLEGPSGRFLSNTKPPSFPIPPIKKWEIGSNEFTDLQDVDLHAHVSLNEHDMVIQISHLSSQNLLNPQHIMDQLSQFATRNKAKRLFVERDPHLDSHQQRMPKSPHTPTDGGDNVFHQWAEKYPIVLERKRIANPGSPNTTSYVFQVPLTTP